MTKQTTVSPGATWELTLRTVGRLLRVFDKELEEKLELPLTWYDVIQHLGTAPDNRLRMQTLSDMLILTHSGATRLIDRIERAGLVRREHAAEDRRGYYAVLTDKGRRILKCANAIHGASIDRQFSQYLNEDELAMLYSAIGKVWNGNPQLAGDSAQH